VSHMCLAMNSILLPLLPTAIMGLCHDTQLNTLKGGLYLFRLPSEK
jgi:hypothetical protein